MPKSRHKQKHPDTRLQARLHTQARELAYATRLIGMIDDALKGKGLEAMYSPEPVPHVEIFTVPQPALEAPAEPDAV